MPTPIGRAWANGQGKPIFTVSTTNVDGNNDGADTGPGTVGTTTGGLAEAIAKLPSSGGGVYIRSSANALQLSATVTVPTNVNIYGDGATIAPATGATFTTPAGYAGPAMLISSGENKIWGVKFILSAATVPATYAVAQNGTGLDVNGCQVSNCLIGIGVSSTVNVAGAQVRNNHFSNAGGITLTIIGASTIVNLSDIHVHGNRWDNTVTTCTIAPDSATTAQYINLYNFEMNDNRILTDGMTNLNTAAVINLGYVGGAVGGGSTKYLGSQNIDVHDNMIIYLSTLGAPVYDIFASSQYGGGKIHDNKIVTGTTTGIQANIWTHGFGTGGQGNIYWQIQDNWISNNPDAYPSVVPIDLIHVEASDGTVNLLQIQNNFLIGGQYGIYVVANGVETNAYGVVIQGNSIDKVAYDCIWVSPPASGQLAEVQIQNNFLLNPNWGGSGTQYAGIAVNRNSATMYGPTLVSGNRTATHQGQSALNLYVGTGVDSTAMILSDNLGLEQSTSGSNAPTALNDSILGAVTSSKLTTTDSVTMQRNFFNQLSVNIQKVVPGNGVYPNLRKRPFFADLTPQGQLYYTTPPTPTVITVGTSPNASMVTPDGKTVYVANEGANTVSVIDSQSNTVTTTISLASGAEPYDVQITPDGRYVYVAQFGTNTVTQIDTETNTLTGVSIAVGSGPFSMAITPDGQYLYVANLNGPSVSVISIASNTVVATISSTSMPAPQAIAVSPDGTKVYVGNGASPYNLNVISTVTNTITTSIGYSTDVYGMGFSPDGGYLYVALGGAGTGANTVSKVNTSTNAIVTSVSVGTGPIGVTVSPDGLYAYVPNNGTNNVSIIYLPSFTVVATVTIGTGPQQKLSVHPNGKWVYVPNGGTNTVSAIQVSTNNMTLQNLTPQTTTSTTAPGASMGSITFTAGYTGKVYLRLIVRANNNTLTDGVTIGLYNGATALDTETYTQEGLAGNSETFDLRYVLSVTAGTSYTIYGYMLAVTGGTVTAKLVELSAGPVA